MNRRHLPAAVLSAWTVLVWTTRIRNIWTDGDLSTGAQVGRTALALAFTVFAVVTIVAVLRARGGHPWPTLPAWIRAFAVWTIGVWVVRAIQIGLADHGAGFIAVHLVLAVVSIGLSVWAARVVSDTTRGGATRDERVLQR